MTYKSKMNLFFIILQGRLSMKVIADLIFCESLSLVSLETDFYLCPHVKIERESPDFFFVDTTES